MLRRIITLTLTGMILVVPILVADYLFVRSGQDTTSIWFNPWLTGVLWALGPAGLFIVTYHVLSQEPLAKYRFALAWALGSSLIWFVFAIQVHIWFHFSIGGKV